MEIKVVTNLLLLQNINYKKQQDTWADILQMNAKGLNINWRKK